MNLIARAKKHYSRYLPMNIGTIHLQLVQGKYLESLDMMEEALNLRREVYGEDSDEVLFLTNVT